MDRRRFLWTSLAGMLAAPLAAEAQRPSTTISRIGLLTDLAWEPLREGLRDLGYTESKNIGGRRLRPSWFGSKSTSS